MSVKEKITHFFLFVKANCEALGPKVGFLPDGCASQPVKEVWHFQIPSFFSARETFVRK